MEFISSLGNLSLICIFMFIATIAITMPEGSKLVCEFVRTFKLLKGAVSLTEFLTNMSGNISGQLHGANLSTQTPQMDIFPHFGTFVKNTKK
jgi:hypothetical protein